jgi:hypothetical protein
MAKVPDVEPELTDRLPGKAPKTAMIFRPARSGRERNRWAATRSGNEGAVATTRKAMSSPPAERSSVTESQHPYSEWLLSRQKTKQEKSLTSPPPSYMRMPPRRLASSFGRNRVAHACHCLARMRRHLQTSPSDLCVTRRDYRCDIQLGEALTPPPPLPYA